jgi:hypothetical protein
LSPKSAADSGSADAVCGPRRETATTSEPVRLTELDRCFPAAPRRRCAGPPGGGSRTSASAALVLIEISIPSVEFSKAEAATRPKRDPAEAATQPKPRPGRSRVLRRHQPLPNTATRGAATWAPPHLSTDRPAGPWPSLVVPCRTPATEHLRLARRFERFNGRSPIGGETGLQRGNGQPRSIGPRSRVRSGGRSSGRAFNAVRAPIRRRRSAVPSDGFTSDRASPPHLQLDPSGRFSGWIRQPPFGSIPATWVLRPRPRRTPAAGSSPAPSGRIGWPRAPAGFLDCGPLSTRSVKAVSSFRSRPSATRVISSILCLWLRRDRSAALPGGDAFGQVFGGAVPVRTAVAVSVSEIRCSSSSRPAGVPPPALVSRQGRRVPTANAWSRLRRFGRCRPRVSWSRRLAIGAPSGRIGRLGPSSAMRSRICS